MTTLLRVLLPARNQDMILGDLLEDVQSGAWSWRQALCLLTASCLFRTGLAWFVVFVAAAAACLAAPSFTPVPAIAVFLISLPLAAFHVARHTGLFRAGFAAGLITGTSIFALGTVLVASLHLPHPPLDALPIPLLLGTLLSSIGAFLGKTTVERVEITPLACCPPCARN